MVNIKLNIQTTHGNSVKIGHVFFILSYPGVANIRQELIDICLYRLH